MKKIDKTISKIKMACLVVGLILAPLVVFVGCESHKGHNHSHGNADGVFELCHKCGEVVGTEKCCKKEGRTKCEKCGLFEGSPGCCKIPKGTTQNVALCKKCGEIKGSDKCCKEEGRKKCEKCGLFEGSPGCCKLPACCKPPKAKKKSSSSNTIRAAKVLSLIRW